MKQYTLILIILFVWLTSVANAQIVRTKGMGGLTFSIVDKDFLLNPYDLAGNPAWLINDEKSDYLEITPSVTGIWGDYKRLYDPSENNYYELLFEGVKTLGTDGTFLGQTSYEYDYRKDVYRTLKYNTYRGEAFFINDTTTGNFRYNGPTMKFMYSFKPVDNFFVGATAKYKILDGLKNVYSRAQTLYRNIYGDIGLAYNFGNDIVAGVKVSINDEQETITADSEDLLDVEVFNYKGETFSIRKRASSVEEKIRTINKDFSGQICFKPVENLEVALIGGFSQGNLKILIPYTISSTNESFQEYEDGYANFNNYNFLLVGQYHLSSDIIVSVKGIYEEDKSWSKNSTLDLLLWEWKTKNIGAGVGGSVKLCDDLLLGIEYELTSSNIDSSKYVDGRVNSVDATCHIGRIGAEYMMLENVFLRFGYNYTYWDVTEKIVDDFTLQGHKFTIGTGIKIFDSFSIDANIEYDRRTSSRNDSIHRSILSGIITVTLFSF